MAYNIVITQQADREMDQILAYLTQQLFSEQAAAALVVQYTDVLEKLEQFPNLFETVRNVGQVGKEYRKFRMGNYVGVYRVQEEEKRVIILRIFHGSQNYARYL